MDKCNQEWNSEIYDLDLHEFKKAMSRYFKINETPKTQKNIKEVIINRKMVTIDEG